MSLGTNITQGMLLSLSSLELLTQQSSLPPVSLEGYVGINTTLFFKTVYFLQEPLGKISKGQTSDVFFVVSSLTVVMHPLNEVIKNIDVYHEFWFEEATNLATRLDIQAKFPGKFHRAQQVNLES